jgi:predicted dehydrogenase
VDNEDTAVFSVQFRSGLAGSFSVSRIAYGMPNELSFDVAGVAGQASLDFHRPAEYIRNGTQVIVGPQLPYFRDGYPIQAAGLGGGYAEMFTYQTRAFLDQVSGAPDPLPPNASFADALHTMEVIQAVVRSAEADGAAVSVS